MKGCPITFLAYSILTHVSWLISPLNRVLAPNLLAIVTNYHEPPSEPQKKTHTFHVMLNI